MRNVVVKGKNLVVAERDRRYALDKLRRLDRLLDDRTQAVVELSAEAHRNVESSHIVEVTLMTDGRTLRAKASALSHQAAIDQVTDKLERQAVTRKRKPLERRRTASRTQAPGAATGAPATDTPADQTADIAPRIVKTKRFAIEPMFEEDAVARMEELGHSFFVFVNAENERLGVLYRRRSGDYGLIEPTVGGEYTPGACRRGGTRRGGA